jgi:hypothetical protein
MEWGTVLFSGVVAGMVSTLASWVTGLHRDRKAAAERAAAALAETAHRREDTRRERLTEAVVDFLKADQQRFDASSSFFLTLKHLPGGAEAQKVAGETVTKLKPPRDAAENALQRVGLYAPALRPLAVQMHDMGGVRPNEEDSLQADREALMRHKRAYRAAVDEFMAAARTELGIVL